MINVLGRASSWIKMGRGKGGLRRWEGWRVGDELGGEGVRWKVLMMEVLTLIVVELGCWLGCKWGWWGWWGWWEWWGWWVFYWVWRDFYSRDVGGGDGKVRSSVEVEIWYYRGCGNYGSSYWIWWFSLIFVVLIKYYKVNNKYKD